MSEVTKRLLGVLLLLGLLTGCQSKSTPPAAPTMAATPKEPSQVELSDAKVAFIEPMLVALEVKYHFVRGEPHQFYALEITFPGTSNHAVRKMQAWELKKEGVLRDRVTLVADGAKTFAMRLDEAASVRSPFKTISNSVTGPINP